MKKAIAEVISTTLTEGTFLDGVKTVKLLHDECLDEDKILRAEREGFLLGGYQGADDDVIKEVNAFFVEGDVGCELLDQYLCICKQALDAMVKERDDLEEEKDAEMAELEEQVEGKDGKIVDLDTELE